jgi:hypothetical protein
MSFWDFLILFLYLGVPIYIILGDIEDIKESLKIISGRKQKEKDA